MKNETPTSHMKETNDERMGERTCQSQKATGRHGPNGFNGWLERNEMDDVDDVNEND